MNGLEFAYPGLWPWLGILLPVTLCVFWALRRRAAVAASYRARIVGRAPSPWARTLRVALALLFLCVAYLEPRYGEEQVAVERRGLDLVFALDTSRSMLARDMEPSRLEAAKRDIRSVVPELKGGDRVGLVAFAGETRLVVPLTHDVDSFRQLLEPVNTSTVRKGGTDLAAAIRAGLELIDGQDQKTSVIILLTDGEDLTGAAQQAAREARDRGVVIHAVGYGSTRGSKITLEESGKEAFLRDEKGKEVVTAMRSDSLRTTCELTGGEFLRSEVMVLPLRQLKQKRLDPMVKRAYDSGQETVYKTRFQWALIPAMLLLMFELFWLGGSK